MSDNEPVVVHHGREEGRSRLRRGAAVCFNSLTGAVGRPGTTMSPDLRLNGQRCTFGNRRWSRKYVGSQRNSAATASGASARRIQSGHSCTNRTINRSREAPKLPGDGPRPRKCFNVARTRLTRQTEPPAVSRKICALGDMTGDYVVCHAEGNATSGSLIAKPARTWRVDGGRRTDRHTHRGIAAVRFRRHLASLRGVTESRGLLPRVH